MSVVIKGSEPFDVMIASNIVNCQTANIKFKNISFRCETIEDADGTVFVKMPSAQPSLVKESGDLVNDLVKDDTISRKQAIDRLETIGYDFSDSGLSATELEEVCEAVGDVRQDMIRMIKRLPPAQPEVIRCKDCKWWGYDDDDGAVRVCRAAKHGHMSSNWSIMIYRTHKGDFYCADAERRTDAD